VLAHVVEGEKARALIERNLNEPSLTQCTYYFRHYLHSAVNLVGEGDRYLDLLGEWDKMLAIGLTTWAEKPEPTRSDCHAWGSHPLFHLHASVAGVRPASPGFRTVRIAPQPGKLPKILSRTPHPDGFIALDLAFEGDRCRGSVELPPDITGVFVWRAKEQKLNSGANAIDVRP